MLKLFRFSPKHLDRLSFISSLHRSRFISTASSNPVRVAIVGSGPAGFYTASYIQKSVPNAHIDMFESLPVPYGLVRYGVAPDHPEVKNVTNKFESIASHPNFNFYGNVTIGKDLAIYDLQANYHSIVLSYGASEDKKLGIPNESLPNVISARSFVNWYNGHPDFANLPIDLENLNSDTAIIIGAGNVALDVARILLMDIEELQKTDIADHAVKMLKRSKIKHVVIVMRRGPLQVAFTSKELREMLALTDTEFKTDRNILEHHVNSAKDELSKDRAKRRLLDLLLKGIQQDSSGAKTKSWTLKFLSTPTEFLSDGKLCQGLNVEKNEFANDGKLQSTGLFEEIKGGIVLRSIGYESTPIDEGIPFDHRKKIIPNDTGRVIRDGAVVPGLYVAGWIKRGATGVIVSTMFDANETATSLIEDINAGRSMNPLDTELSGFEELEKRLKDEGVQTVSFSDWEKIDKLEKLTGEAMGKSRLKLIDVNEMINTATTK
ncbi:ribosomal protein S5 [Nowakowskiella sp. JEL0407]|nr:ribosomal protein S5 [Nowakowskiella sp. JEL0407]